MTEENKQNLVEILKSITADKKDDDYISLFEINSILHERGFALLIMIFSFPMAIPLPYPPGFTTILGIPLLFYSILMILGKKNPWLPNFIGKKTLKISHVNVAVNKIINFLSFLNRVTKPRLLFMVGKKGEQTIGLVSLLCSISIALPIIFGNAVPSLGILIMSIGLLFADGLVVLLGILTSIFGLFIAGAVVFLGVKVVKAVFAKIVALLL